MTNQQAQWGPSPRTVGAVENRNDTPGSGSCAPGRAEEPRGGGVGTPPPPWVEWLASLRAEELSAAARVLRRVAEGCEVLAAALGATGEGARHERASSPMVPVGEEASKRGERAVVTTGSSPTPFAEGGRPAVVPEVEAVQNALARCDLLVESAVPHGRCTPLSLAGWFAGDRYPHIRRAFRALRGAAHTGGAVELFAWDWPLDELNATAQWLQMLEQARVLRHRGYDRSRRRFVVVPDWGLSWVRGFLGGGWMEHWAAEVIRRRVFGKHCQEAPIARNVLIALSPSHRAEFDVLAVLPDGGLLWVELKSGSVDRSHLDVYAQRRRRLGVSVDRALVACTGLDDTLEQDIRARQLTPVTLSTLGDAVVAVVEQASQRPPGPLAAALAPLLQSLEQ